MKRRDRVLLVDDDAGIRAALGRYLRGRGFDTSEAASCAEAEASLSAGPDIALIDLRLPDGDGVELIPRLRAVLPQLLVVVLTAHGSIDTAVRAMKEGADQFLTKPVDMEALLLVLGRVLEDGRNRRRQMAARGSVPTDPFACAGPALGRLREDAEQALASDLPVLIVGETGSGKGVLARWLHGRSGRADQPLVDINCAGISRDLLESELFGHEAGAFTGAVKAKQGLLEVAHKGTVFLDEIGDMDPGIQARLLKVLEERRFRRLGDVRDRVVDVRLVAATHQDVGRMMEEGRFRRDLYYRVAAIELRIPPLRERLEDVPALARAILDAFARETGRPAPALSGAAATLLQAHSWPGNVRELRNVLETAALRRRTGEIQPEDLRLRAPGSPEAGPEEPGERLSLAQVERAHIERVLAAQGGHVARAAQVLEISTSSLYERLHKYGLGGAARGRGTPASKAT